VETTIYEFFRTGVKLLAAGLIFVPAFAWADAGKTDYQAARWDARHFKPLIEKTSDAECLSCHVEVLAPSVRPVSPAGVRADRSLAWYQTLDTYTGVQDTLHRRHLSSPYAQQVMNLRCNTCHQGHDPRDEAPGTSKTAQSTGYALRKQVDPKTCLMCHGQFDWQTMGLPGHWRESSEAFGNNCLTCHAGIRTTRHQVNFLKPEAIEAAGQDNADVCFGCHGGRPWYRISYPYPRHAWEGMDKEMPDWAKGRPTQSEPRFRMDADKGASFEASDSLKKFRSGAIHKLQAKPAG
jgi:nitrate/TMAO reductase-like tetraheme cytochrome c subunit